MITLTEKLELISELESENFNADTIEHLVESLEHPENNKSFNNIEDFWSYFDAMEDINEENWNYSCFWQSNEEGA